MNIKLSFVVGIGAIALLSACGGSDETETLGFDETQDNVAQQADGEVGQDQNAQQEAENNGVDLSSMKVSAADPVVPAAEVNVAADQQEAVVEKVGKTRKVFTGKTAPTPSESVKISTYKNGTALSGILFVTVHAECPDGAADINVAIQERKISNGEDISNMYDGNFNVENKKFKCFLNEDTKKNMAIVRRARGFYIDPGQKLYVEAWVGDGQYQSDNGNQGDPGSAVTWADQGINPDHVQEFDSGIDQPT